MEKKRSIGVKIFGYSGIVFGIWSVIQELLIISPSPDLIRTLAGFAFIFLSCSLLQLKNWSRILLLIINSIFAILVTISNVFILFSLPWTEVVGIFKKVYPDFTIIILIMSIISYFYFLSFLIFFTRPKVKEQFR